MWSAQLGTGQIPPVHQSSPCQADPETSVPVPSMPSEDVGCIMQSFAPWLLVIQCQNNENYSRSCSPASAQQQNHPPTNQPQSILAIQTMMYQTLSRYTGILHAYSSFNLIEFSGIHIEPVCRIAVSFSYICIF